MHRNLWLLAFLVSLLVGQETPGTLSEHAYDQSGAALRDATVGVINLDTGKVITLTTNAGGYYEATLLLPGQYRMRAAVDGFKSVVRDRIGLDVGASVASSAEAEALITNRDLMDLTVMDNNPTLLAKLVPGMQTNGVNNYLGLDSIIGGSSYNVAAGVGGNDWSIGGGVPNNRGSRRAAYLPYSDSLSESHFNTSGFDVSLERCAARGPDSYQVRLFPTRLPGVRRDQTRQMNANLQREIPLYKERARLSLRVDMLNVFNRSQFDSPSTDPLNTFRASHPAEPGDQPVLTVSGAGSVLKRGF